MVARTATSSASGPTRTTLDVCLGKAERPLGRLIFVKDGQREFSQFAYSEERLTDVQFLDASLGLNRRTGSPISRY